MWAGNNQWGVAEWSRAQSACLPLDLEIVNVPERAKFVRRLPLIIKRIRTIQLQQ